eukprot:gnl/MRDRNA2_/MRDRNA2_107619_c0_seq1.p1 gnl/MRDRNA2_/MRDRNA2_107619_c0~~gnl/MRDRNA2_/MRDRNA2_107619_c0_seq1.p1  ORF type:complete len:1009 (+),score=180.67 gnl/MRDRNA2_/MRDRNA2_107619_c0_seq1:102-3128(+)
MAGFASIWRKEYTPSAEALQSCANLDLEYFCDIDFSPEVSLQVFEDDPQLKEMEQDVWLRVNGYNEKKDLIDQMEGGLLKFSEGYKRFGFNRVESRNKWTFTEWLPNAKNVFLIGDFNNWENKTELRHMGQGRWTCDLPDLAPGEYMVKHKTQVRVRFETQDGRWLDRVPAWIKLAWQDKATNLFNGVFWEPSESERYKFKHGRPPKPDALKIYEAHVGMGTCDAKVGTYLEFKDIVLPRIKRLGYNCVQFMAIAEHSYYGSFGYHVTSYFAPASRSGTPEELKELIDTAHGMGFVVLMDLVHAHCSKNTIDGISEMDGTCHCYTHGGDKGWHPQWDSGLFHYSKWEVQRFLLSNVRWWIEEYGFDGYRFDGVTSMLYHSHGLDRGFEGGYEQYFGIDVDLEAHVYLMLANDLVHTLLPKSGISIAEDVSGMPTLCRPLDEGGFGFDYRFAMSLPYMWIKMLKEPGGDFEWSMGYIAEQLQKRRLKEKTIAYVECHDQSIVGDQTLAQNLLNEFIYSHMSTMAEYHVTVDRGMALHKMIRLITLGLGGEGYLNFMGNEFGHPEWVDFPREGNEFTHHYCRRRWDLPHSEDLKYKFLDKFDELMQACESRFKFAAAENQYCSKSDDYDKVIVFERGPCVFVFNFHPTTSYTDYLIGHQYSEGMKIILDTDEGWFGGQMRLEWGHANSFPALDGHDGRFHSSKIYCPARTAQILVRESLLTTGITVLLDEDSKWPCPKENLKLEIDKGESGIEIKKFDASKGGFHIGSFNMTFKLFWEPSGKQEKDAEAKSSCTKEVSIFADTAVKPSSSKEDSVTCSNGGITGSIDGSTECDPREEEMILSPRKDTQLFSPRKSIKQSQNRPLWKETNCPAWKETGVVRPSPTPTPNPAPSPAPPSTPAAEEKKECEEGKKSKDGKEGRPGCEYLAGGPFRIYFPGKYLLRGSSNAANLVCIGDQDAPMPEDSGDGVPNSAKMSPESQKAFLASSNAANKEASGGYSSRPAVPADCIGA